MTARSYHALIASLPYQAHFADAKPVPLTPHRLEQRLRALHADDLDQLRRAEPLTGWSARVFLLARKPGDGLSAEADLTASERLAEILAGDFEPCLQPFLRLRRDQRLIAAALRARQGGASEPVAGRLDPRFAPAALLASIRRNPSQGDLGLARTHPWVPTAAAALRSGDALALERALMDHAWTHARRLRDSDPFGFAGVAGWFFAWQMRASWAAHDPAAAGVRFHKLLTQALPE